MREDTEFIAFDIECSFNYRNNYEICLFAYIRTDSNLDVIESEEIYVHTKRPRGKLKTILQNLNFDKVDQAPEYEEQYHKIMKVLNSENTILVAHSGNNDLKFMFFENDRYGLENYSGGLFDTFLLTKERYPELKMYSVVELCKQWDIEHEIEHDALSDARACIEFIKHICKEDNITPLELFEKYREKAYTTTEDVYRDLIRIMIRDKIKEHAVEEMEPNTVCFLFDIPYEKTKNIEITEKLVKIIMDAGGSYSFNAPIASYMVADEGSDTRRVRYARSMGIEIITPDEIEDRLFKNRKDIKITFK